jgi:amino acid adenylation domain-containing protein/non-ribosomal peptide synthase protein (TIGR01720 family)
MQPTRLSELLIALRDTELKGITFLESDGCEEFLSYGALYRAARRSLTSFRRAGLVSGNELVFQTDDNKAFIIAFWACQLGGIIPVPLSAGKNDDHLQKLSNVWNILRKPYLMASSAIMEKISTFAGLKGLESVLQVMESRRIDEPDDAVSEPEGEMVTGTENDIAFIQFSSGSTGAPKGVILSHKNLLTNLSAITQAARYTERDSILNWMPLTHDMGLIGFHLNPLFCGINQYLMPVNQFVRRPALWLDKAVEYGATILSSPNFGYKHFLDHYKPEACTGWDLSRIRIIYNGAEPISKDLCTDFLARLSAYGLKAEAICPVYGLAEATLAVTISNPENCLVAVNVNRNQVNRGNKVSVADGHDPGISLVNVGKPVDNCHIRVADEMDEPVVEGVIGEVQIRGENVTSGYYNNREATERAILPDGWLKTGDLGLMLAGALHITGRLKDVFFVNGQNYYPHDLERIAQEIEGIELNRIVMSGFYNDRMQRTEVVAFLQHRGDPEGFVRIVQRLRAKIAKVTGVEIDRAIPVTNIPKTTSGKLQRFKLIERLEAGEFEDIEGQLNVLYKQLSGDHAGPGAENRYEEKLLQIWKDVLKTDDIDPERSFLEVGGNSLKAVEASMRMAKEFPTSAGIDLYDAKQTIREIARAIEASGEPFYLSIPESIKQELYPLSPAQRGLYYQWEADRHSIAYNLPLCLQIEGEVDANRLEGCIDLLIRRHETLRNTFQGGTEPGFRIGGAEVFALECAACDPENVDLSLRRMVRPFDLSAWPLFRIGLLKAGNREYYLFLDFHHIITDGISLYHFIDELFQLYHGQPLVELPIQYKDYVNWQSMKQASDAGRQHRDYWLSKLGPEWPALELPADMPRPPVFSTEGAKIEIKLPAETTARLVRLARSNGCTLHVVLFTLYKLLLHKITGQKDIIIGIPVAGRMHPDLQHVQGMFVNSIAIRSGIRGDEPFPELLARERDNIAEALRHQDHPFENVIRDKNRRRDAARNPVFDTMFIYQNMGLPGPERTGFPVSRHFFDPGFSKYDISLEVFEENGSISYYIEYASRLFDESTVRRFAHFFECLIQQVTDRPEDRLPGLSLMTRQEQEAHLYRFNSTSAEYPSGKTIHGLFKEQAGRSPGAIAVEHDHELLTYRQLDQRASQFAALLVQKGVLPNTIVAILLERSPDLVAGILGILKAGAAFLPIDPALPGERVRYLIKDSRCRFVITASTFKDNDCLKELADGHIIDINDPAVLNGARVIPDSGSAQDLAYVIYTSGTTGRPKGVKVGHGSLVNYAWWAAREYCKEDRVVFPLYTSISFDLTITSIFVPLITGNSIIIYREDNTTVQIERVVAENKATVIKLTPSHLRIIKDISLPYPASAASVKRFIVGGEALMTQLARDIYEKFQGMAEICNEYGPTEATVGCMLHRFSPEEGGLTVPIGAPAANTQLYILDEFLKPVPTGVNGELYISGDCLALGYLYNEELTDQRFPDNPFLQGSRMYRTGDCARWLPGSIIEYTGRSDRQIKISGYRVEPGEIEYQLQSFPGIIEALVTMKSKERGPGVLYAYFRSAEAIQERALREYLTSRLPYYMLPVHFIRLDVFPLTENGKVDHSALPAAERKPTEYGTPDNIERILINIWEDVLGVGGLCVSDDFFELGGDSIIAVQVVSRAHEHGIVLHAKDVLTYHTIAQLSRHSHSRVPVSAAAEAPLEGERGLTPIETWFFGQGFANPGYYNQSVLLRLRKPVDKSLLEAAFGKVVERHDGLRMNHNPRTGSLFYNSRHLKNKFVVASHTLSADDPADKFTALCEDIKNGFDLANDLLIKAALIEENASPGMLLITAHHLVIDGISWRILLDDLYGVYKKLESGKPVGPVLKTASLPEWERELKKLSDSPVARAWDAYRASVEQPVWKIPVESGEEDRRSENASILSGYWSREKTSLLIKEAQRVYGADIPVLANMALVQTLKDWTGGDRFVIEQENHGRHLENVDVSRTLGWFTVMYPLILEWRPGSMGEQIMWIKEQIRRVPDHGIGCGFSEQSGTLQEVGARKGPNIRLNYLGRFDKEFSNDLFEYSRRWTGRDTDPANVMTASLEFNIMILTGEMYLDITYNRKAHSLNTVKWLADAFLGQFDRLLEHMSKEAGEHLRPSDFDAANLAQEELDLLFK